MIKTLTEEERQFATENHNTIFGFLHFKNLDTDLMYSVVVEAYLAAVMTYFRKPEKREQYTFANLAYTSMGTALKMYWRKRFSSAGTKKPEVPCDFSSPLFPELICLTADLKIQDPTDVAAQNEVISKIMGSVTGRERTIIRMLYEGRTQDEIALRIGCSQGQVSKQVAAVREKLKTTLAVEIETGQVDVESRTGIVRNCPVGSRRKTA